MIGILNIGLNHKTAPVELRERFALDDEKIQDALTSVRSLPCIKEGLFLSTCNRVESLCITDEPETAREEIISLIANIGNVTREKLLKLLYEYQGMDAVSHIFRVSSSLDSMVMGEPQILGQVKEAYRYAVNARTSGIILNRLMHRAFRTAKRVRTETGISDSAVSVSYSAVELAKKIFFRLEGRSVLLVGAGEMAELSARHLINNGVSRVFIANRTFERALQLAKEFRGTAVSFEELQDRLTDVDIVLTSTGAQGYVIHYAHVKEAMKKRKNRPLFFIDIAVPRDVAPEINNLSNVYLYDIDDLKNVIEINLEKRKQEAVKAERIIKEEVVKFEKWLTTLEVVPTIKSLKEKVEQIRVSELKKTLSQLKDIDPEKKRLIETLTISITDKILNDPIIVLKRKADRPTRDLFLDITKELFNLNSNNREN